MVRQKCSGIRRSYLVSMSENDTGQVNPIISMKNLGDRLIAGAETSFVAYGAAKAIAAGANETFVGWVANKFVGATAAFKEGANKFLI